LLTDSPHNEQKHGQLHTVPDKIMNHTLNVTKASTVTAHGFIHDSSPAWAAAVWRVN